MFRRFLPFAIVLVSALSGGAQEPQAPSPPPAAVFSPDRPFDPAAATQAWLATVPPEKRAKSDAYFEGRYWLLFWNFLLGAAISIFLLQSRISARMRDLAERITRSKTLQAAFYAILFTLITSALAFPLLLFENFFREHAYGLATQTFAAWFGDQLKGLVIGLIGNAILIVLLYHAFRRAPRLWWAFGAGISVFLWGIAVMVGPVFIAPVFNKYRPLADPEIRDPILALARANQIPVDQVFEFDASRQTNRISANVSGLFGTTRISLNDNLLKQCTVPEIRYVMGHEMGHYVLNHMTTLVSGFAIFAFIGFFLARTAFELALRRWGGSWDVRGIADPAGLPLLVLIFSIFAFVLTPVINTASRVTERGADSFGLNVSREADGMAQAALKLGAYRKLNPGPVEEFVFYDHPSGRARIRMAMDWKAAQLPAGDVR